MASIGGKGILHAKGPFWGKLDSKRLGLFERIKTNLVEGGLTGAGEIPESDFSFDATWTFFELLLGVTLPTNKDDKTATESAGARTQSHHTRTQPKDSHLPVVSS